MTNGSRPTLTGSQNLIHYTRPRYDVEVADIHEVSIDGLANTYPQVVWASAVFCLRQIRNQVILQSIESLVLVSSPVYQPDAQDNAVGKNIGRLAALLGVVHRLPGKLGLNSLGARNLYDKGHG